MGLLPIWSLCLQNFLVSPQDVDVLIKRFLEGLLEGLS